ncbi:MAG TPA: GGDEF domain-containing protein [Pseudonocardiaceae bacterium]|nr:GGDEF domain-containing protein [Pseudonocardiaceae bacterium]
MPALLDDVQVVYQPVFNLHTGGVMAVEAKARPTNGSVRSLLRHAADTGQLTPTDYGLAAAAIRRAAEHDTRIPLHVNLLAVSVGRAHVAAAPLLEALRETGRRPADVVLELNPPFSSVRWSAFRQGVTVLRDAGFRLAVDKIGDGDAPVTLLGWPEIDLIKLDRSLTAGAPHEPRLRATVESMVALCERGDLQLIAEAITTPDELETLHGLGIRLAQGDLLCPASHRPTGHVTITPMTGDPLVVVPAEQPDRTATPKVTELMHPATTLPATATADDVRSAFATDQEASCVVLLDDAGRPEWMIDRNRFLLAVTGPYGHALHARRSATRLADKPRVVPIGATVFDLLDVLSGGERSRGTDDVIVVDAAFRCLGVVRATDLVRAVADSKVEEAAALNPLTRLPGSASVDRSVTRRIRDGDVFAVGWLDIDAFKTVNDRFGFAAGDDLIRDVGRCLAEAAENQADIRVSHIGGDDFVFVSALDHLMPLANRLIDTAWAVNGVPVSLSLATLVCAAGSVTGYREVSRMLAPLKLRAKAITGSSWVVGRPGTERIDVLRSGQGRPRPVSQPPPPPSMTATLPRHTPAKAG